MSNTDKWKEFDFKPIQVDLNPELEAMVHIYVSVHRMWPFVIPKSGSQVRISILK